VPAKVPSPVLHQSKNWNSMIPYSSFFPPAVTAARSIEAFLATGEVKRELRLRELNRDLDLGNLVLQSDGLETVDIIEFPCKANVGTYVKTLFGPGEVVNFRKSDGIYEIHVDLPNTTTITTDTHESERKKIKLFLPGLSIRT
jgi:hypothetical protein